MADFIDKNFLVECMSVPTYSKFEYHMVSFIVHWAMRNQVKYEFDGFGNLYLTKGELRDGEYYPCVTSHLDTVQIGHIPYINAMIPLSLKIDENEYGQHELYVDDAEEKVGIGSDDKSGICICLSIFNYFDKLKACFFLEEEIGCNGSNRLDENWFKDVGYVIGFDSPDLYRAAWSCQGVKLFSYDFYEKYMKDVCDAWGLTKGCFFSEPYTDVKLIREKTGIICMNFGNGGYNAHNMGGPEYCIIEDMDQACGMGIDLIDSIGLTRHYLEHGQDDSEDTFKLKLLGDITEEQRKIHGKTATSADIKLVRHYDKHIDNMKNELLEDIKGLCEKNGVDFEEFSNVISSKFDNKPLKL